MKANYLILAVASFICLTACNAKLPEEAKSVIFQSPTFQKPIYVSVPQPDEESSFLNFLEYPTITDESFMPSIDISTGKDFSDYNLNLISYLVKNKILEVKLANRTTITRFGQTTKTFHFALYNSPYKSNLVKFSDQTIYGILAGRRKLASIDSEDKVDQNINGNNVKVYTVVFSYNIETDLPGLDEFKSKIFTGKVEVYSDPTSKQWQMSNLQLNDKGENDFLQLIQQTYQPFTDPEVSKPYADLNLNGENVMEKGVFFKFKVNYDDPGISFNPNGSDTTVLSFYKAEDKTRNWRLKLWKDNQGNKQYLFSPIQPSGDVLVGTVFVCCENKTNVVNVNTTK